MEKIFVSYRRDGNRWATGRICDRLNRYFGSERVFRDIEDIKYGSHFPQRIEESIQNSALMLVIMGEKWLALKGDDGTPRILQEGDWVRKEIEIALKNNVEVIPVVLDDARMPTREQIPESFGKFTEINAVFFRDENFDANMKQLLQQIHQTLIRSRTGLWGKITRFFRSYLTIVPLAFALGCLLMFLIHSLEINYIIGVQLQLWPDPRTASIAISDTVITRSYELRFLWGYLFEALTLMIYSILMIAVYRMFRVFGLMLAFGLGAILGDILMLHLLIGNLALDATFVIRILWVVILALIVQSESVQAFINMLLAIPRKLAQPQYAFGDKPEFRRM
ncbi:MAG: toll/interleukin-1 receptor domain-containing protein [Anaerolineae bacterium]|nr:toll/interleukin-1 receptor domain-containing protein [Anaerolineae bacterium]